MQWTKVLFSGLFYLIVISSIQGQDQAKKMIVLINGVATEARVSLTDGQILEVIREIPNYFPSHYKSYTLKEILAQNPQYLKDDDAGLVVLEDAKPIRPSHNQHVINQAQPQIIDQNQTDLSMIEFDPKNAALSDLAIQELDKTIAQMKADPSSIANIQYNLGGPQYMQDMIQRRAKAIKRYMQLKHISTARITLEETIGSANSSVAVKLVKIVR